MPFAEVAVIVNAGLALPLSRIVCGESGASSVIVIPAEREPAASGAKTTVRVQFALGE